MSILSNLLNWGISEEASESDLVRAKQWDVYRNLQLRTELYIEENPVNFSLVA